MELSKIQFIGCSTDSNQLQFFDIKNTTSQGSKHCITSSLQTEDRKTRPADNMELNTKSSQQVSTATHKAFTVQARVLPSASL